MISSSPSSCTQTLPDEKLVLARIIRAHGLKGALRVKSFTENPADFSQYSLTDRHGKKYNILSSAQQCDSEFFNVFFEGITSRTEAEKLNGIDLLTPKKDLPTVSDNTFYYADLIGMSVFLKAEPEVLVGKVIAVHNFGAGDLLEIQDIEGGKKDSWMVLFASHQIANIDLTSQKIWIEGRE